MANERIQRLQKLLAGHELDCALFAPSADMQYYLDDTTYPWQRSMFTGGLQMFADPSVSGHFLNRPDAILLIPTVGEPTLFLTYRRARDMHPAGIATIEGFFDREVEMLEPFLSGFHRIGLGESCHAHLKYLLSEIDTKFETEDVQMLSYGLRKIKDSKEIAALRRSAAFTDSAMEKIVQVLRPGITAHEVEETICRIGLEGNCQDLAFPPSCRFVKSDSPEAMQINGFGKHRPLEPGCTISFDMGYVLDGYCSDYGRSFYSGPACPEMADGYKALQEAQMYLLEQIRPGVGINICFNTIHERMEQLGCGKHLRKFGDFGLMGHQIGIDVHEHPWLHSDQKEVFEPGMVMCIEPKYWWPGKGFVRVEDMVLITETGCESLTKFSRDLFSLPLD